MGAQSRERAARARQRKSRRVVRVYISKIRRKLRRLPIRQLIAYIIIAYN